MSSAAATNASAGAGPVKPLIVVVENKAEDFEDDWTEATEFHPSNLNAKDSNTEVYFRPLP